jgi:hypothetical protein
VFFEQGLGLKPVMYVESCIFTNFENYIWWSERGIRRFFRDNYIRNCALVAAFHTQGFAGGPVMVGSNIWDNCSGNMWSGGLISGAAYVRDNLQITGSMVLNASTLVTYADNIGF